MKTVTLFIGLFVMSVTAAEPVVVYRCAGNSYQSAPCDAGRRIVIDPDANVLAAETRRPLHEELPSGPSVVVIPRPAPATFEGPSKPHPPLIFGPPTINVRVVR